MKYYKKKKGNIILALLVALLLASTTLALYVGFARDKKSTNLSMSRMQEKIEMNSYIVAAQTSIFDYFNTIEIPIVYAQYTSVNGEENILHKVAVTDPIIISTKNLQNKQSISVSDKIYTLLRQDKNANFAGYQYDIEIAFDVAPENIEQEFRVANLMIDPEVEFWEDNDAYYKSADAYTVLLKDIPMIIVIHYDTWEQQIKAVISGLEFKREAFESISTEEYPSLEQADIYSKAVTGVSRGVIITNNAQMKVIESYRFRR